MTSLNWNIFKTKFHQFERTAFESLAYMLFCYEHEIRIGIFRFKNQTGIETEPIEYNGETVGFQAKYFDTKLSENKDDIIDSIQKAKAKNPLLDKILIYTNQEHSESRSKTKKKPAYLLAIEDAAKNLKIKIEWRVNSHIERQLSVPENAYLNACFFETGKSIVDFLASLSSHSETILFPIHTDIQFGGKQIKVDRSSLAPSLLARPTQVIILSGDGGSGKTALIKECWSKTRPFYVLKAGEFNRPSVAELLRDFGEFGLSDFIAAHREEHERTFVIDSAEKLSDLENQDTFIEFLSALIANEWKVIFTTRNSYLDDLRFQMLEVYRLPFQTLSLENLTDEQLELLSVTYQFKLPKDPKLHNLIKNLFYLQEYLGQYDALNDEVDYAKFRDLLWQKRIQFSRVKKNNIHLDREKCFLMIARIRCDSGNFFLSDIPCPGEVLSLLAKDEIIKYDDSQNGYFITHDIYEEWALEKIIEKEFAKFSSYADFFEMLGSALPMRRAFRSWLSSELLQEDPAIRMFIESSFTDCAIPGFWKDELIVSILLSDHCAWFFDSFETTLLESERHYLKLIIFLLRTACKEVDPTLQKLMQSKTSSVNPAILFTKPKGKGWEAVIDFLHKHITLVSKEDLDIILPMLKDWINQNPIGAITRLAGLFALHFYKDSEVNKSIHYRSETEKQLLEVVLGAARELKEELGEITKGLLDGKYNRRNEFDGLRDKVLGNNNDSLHFIVALPELTIRLADQTWHQPNEDRHPFSGGIGVEKYYEIRDHVHHDYHPASALQTPIYYLLLVAFPQTIQFILDFTNRATAAYALSEYGDTIEEVEIEVDGIKSKQFISLSLWCMYRGSGSPVTPYLLQSIHMALEKKLMEMAKNTDGKNLINWMKHLLIHSRSASITAVVTSVVLAYPNKLFEIALLLFRQYTFFKFDNLRLSRESEAQSIYSIWRGMSPQHKEFEDERMATCNEPHRKKALEHFALESQFFRTGEISDEQAQQRRDAILGIIDDMYASLEGKDPETEKNKILRLFLARIDSRKMSPKVEVKDGNSIIYFNPELAPDLQQFSEEGTRQYHDKFKHTPLKMWAMSKFDKRHESGSYPQYEENPHNVLKDTKQLIEELNKGNGELFFTDTSITAFTCAALLKYHSNDLSKADLKYCRDIILQFAVRPLQEGYDYQISDGVEVAISTLPYLYALFPKERKDYNFILLFILFDDYPIGEYKRVCDYAIEAIRFKLFSLEPKQANEILLGYLSFKPLLNKAINPRKMHQQKVSRIQVVQKFAKTKANTLDGIRGTMAYYNKINFDKLSIDVIDTFFQAMSDDTEDPIHLDFLKKTLEKFSRFLLIQSRYDDEDKVDHRLRSRFLRKYARFLLYRQSDTIEEWLKPFVNPFLTSENMASFISDVVSEQDRLQQYDQFWKIWNSLYPHIKKAVQSDPNRYLDSIIHNYLLAWSWWNDTAKEWHTLKPKDAAFFKKACEEIGNHPAVLYSISKLLNEVGAPFLNEGIHWIVDMISKHKNLIGEEIHPNTIYYLNLIARRFVYLNRTKIKANRMLRNNVLILLDYLFAKGSVSGYLLREEVF
jgi:hypothetical protein